MRNDQGAVLVLVIVSIVALLGMAAMVVDVGMSQVNKRSLQKGADSASLAAASEIIRLTNATQTCSQITTRWTSDATFRQQVTNVADSYASANTLLSSQRADIQVSCSADNKRVEVLYANRGTTQGPFAGIFGGGALTKERSATADLFVREQGTGLRPYFVCDADVLAKLRGTIASGQFVAINYPSSSTSCKPYSGDWYTADCPRDKNNGTLDVNTEVGCLNEIGVVIDQTTTPPPTQGNIDAAILASCTDATSKPPTYSIATCLGGNPGNVGATKVIEAWDYLLTLPGIAVPTFNQAWNDYASTNIKDCGGGNNACYPIEAIAGVQVCAYKWAGGKTNKSTDTVGCPGILGLTFPKDNDNYLYLRAKNIQYSGSSTPGSCPVGGNCDLGGRGTRLIR